MAVPQELKDTPITLDSDPRKRRAVKAVTAAALSSSSQMEGSRTVAETPTQQNIEKTHTCDGLRLHENELFQRLKQYQKNRQRALRWRKTGIRTS